MYFQNPNNGYIEQVSLPFLWTLLFGPIYFAVKGVWTHAVVSFLLAGITAGISWLFYPFFAKRVVQTNYLRRGWLPLSYAEVRRKEAAAKEFRSIQR